MPVKRRYCIIVNVINDHRAEVIRTLIHSIRFMCKITWGILDFAKITLSNWHSELLCWTKTDKKTLKSFWSSAAKLWAIFWAPEMVYNTTCYWEPTVEVFIFTNDVTLENFHVIKSSDWRLLQYQNFRLRQLPCLWVVGPKFTFILTPVER